MHFVSAMQQAVVANGSTQTCARAPTNTVCVWMAVRPVLSSPTMTAGLLRLQCARTNALIHALDPALATCSCPRFPCPNGGVTRRDPTCGSGGAQAAVGGRAGEGKKIDGERSRSGMDVCGLTPLSLFIPPHTRTCTHIDDDWTAQRA